MAYPTVSAPYGFKPINRLDGMPYAGATRQIKIASGYAANVFNGDLVAVVTGGTAEKFAGTTSGSPSACLLVAHIQTPQPSRRRSPNTGPRARWRLTLLLMLWMIPMLCLRSL